MSGETNLTTLLENMHPVLCDGVYVFHSSKLAFSDVLDLDPALIFKEMEGTALILKQERADEAGRSYHYPSRMITLNVHSSLDAVGFLATITARLADADISVNSVSAHFHDHLFVPVARAEEAMDILRSFSK